VDLSYGFKAYDARILIRSNDPALHELALSITRKCLLDNIRPHAGTYDVTLDLTKLPGGAYEMRRNGEHLSSGENLDLLPDYLNQMVRISVAEFSRDLLFIHAGAVGWRGKGILLPALSHRGKSSFVHELVSAGAEYYSDDFAILDQMGELHPFARPISMRGRNGDPGTYEVDAVQELGAKVGVTPVPVGLILITEYRARVRWRPRMLTVGEGVLATLPFAIPLQRYPEKCLRILNLVGSHAAFAQTPRGDAKRAALQLLEFMDALTS